ncbi:hypothetical protein HX882_07840 [Pseudomonas gingeri]|uniref:Flagellar assembly protein FliH n=1 Tax=Pseudomonas gingeri TaxID=117681 RepID=A0A7Y8C1Q7_9PSED|nr:FliH/SctL family protein [Pseudomonas gingeri]NWB95794.1 hypothetical protein [Pseudomonas gingeri]
MSALEPPLSSTVLRQPSQSQGARRLPGIDTRDQETAQVSQDRQRESMNALRATFASELAELEREARAKGLAQGRQDGVEQARAELAKALVQQEQQWLKKETTLREALDTQRLKLGEVVDALKQQRERLLSTLEPIVGRLALAVTTRLLGQQHNTRSLVADLARQAIEEYRLSGPLRIRVARVDYEALQRLAPDDALLASLQIDPEAAAGSCLIDFEGGQLDAGLDTQLEQARASLVPAAQGGDRVAGA